MFCRDSKDANYTYGGDDSATAVDLVVEMLTERCQVCLKAAKQNNNQTRHSFHYKNRLENIILILFINI